MNKIIASLAVMILAGAVIAGGATTAFFSDTETSTGNTFTAGAIDLKIDNESYYNGNKCTDIDGDGPGDVWQWQGNAAFPVPDSECSTSWVLDDLDKGYLFFDFLDLKPDDEGEDTISIHVQNDAWACLDMSLTSDDDKSSTEPELGTPDVLENANDTWDGELADTIQMFWWADDGDNVYEVGEESITDGVQSITNMFGPDKTFSVALADATGNVWGGTDPLPANETVYIAKAWCMGTLSLTPVPAGQGVNPSVASGVACDGAALNNLTQTDSTTMDIAFRAVQSRNNARFVCNEEEERFGTLTVIKQIVNDNGGNNVVPDFQLSVVGTVVTNVTSGIPTNLAPDTYIVTETGISGYVASFSGDCDATGQVILGVGENKTCTITNNDLTANITLIKSVINNNGGTKVPVQFPLLIDAGNVPNNTSIAVTSNAAHTINETQQPGYAFSSITGSPKCPLVLGGTATLDEGEAITCTITNDDIAP